MHSNIISKEIRWSNGVPRLVNFILHHDELAVTIIIAVHLYVDWYLGLAFAAQLLALGLLLMLFASRSAQRPWAKPRALWLWMIFLVLALFPAVRGITLRDEAYYYFNVVFNALLMYWIGLLIAQDTASVRQLFKFLSILAALLAIHTLIEAKTGVLLFKTSRYDAAIQKLANFALGNTGAYRYQGFFLNPDTNGTFFAMALFPPLGLFVDSASWRGKLLYFVEMALILLALHYTYSTGAWIAAFVGVICFLVIVGRMRYRLLIAGGILASAALTLILFPAQVYLQIRHIRAPNELSLRIAAWETALRVIRTFPLTGLGLGRYVYMQRADPYRVPGQIIPLPHPHNAYLELAALGGIPMAIVFMLLLLFSLWLAVRNWFSADTSVRPLLAGGIAAIMALSFNSLAAAGWTCPPLAALGWLLLGTLSSQLITKNQPPQTTAANPGGTSDENVQAPASEVSDTTAVASKE